MQGLFLCLEILSSTTGIVQFFDFLQLFVKVLSPLFKQADERFMPFFARRNPIFERFFQLFAHTFPSFLTVVCKNDCPR